MFSARQLSRLQRRVGELDEDRWALKGAQKELKREHASLLREKAAKEQKVGQRAGSERVGGRVRASTGCHLDVLMVTAVFACHLCAHAHRFALC